MTSRYSVEFQNRVAMYVTGRADDRGDKTLFQLETGVQNARSFFKFCERYFSLNNVDMIEIGCGTAYICEAAWEAGARVEATDFVTECAQIASDRFRDLGISGIAYQSDLRDPPPASKVGFFDYVHCYQVIEHIPRADQFKALRNLFAYVKPGGYLFIDTENSLAPYDRHDTQSWLLRLMQQDYANALIQKLGLGLNFFEPSHEGKIALRDYLSYDELIGAATIFDFQVIDPFMPHGSKHQYLRSLTKSDWLHDTILKYFDIERFSPIALLLRKKDI